MKTISSHDFASSLRSQTANSKSPAQRALETYCKSSARESSISRTSGVKSSRQKSRNLKSSFAMNTSHNKSANDLLGKKMKKKKRNQSSTYKAKPQRQSFKDSSFGKNSLNETLRDYLAHMKQKIVPARSGAQTARVTHDSIPEEGSRHSMQPRQSSRPKRPKQSSFVYSTYRMRKSENTSSSRVIQPKKNSVKGYCRPKGFKVSVGGEKKGIKTSKIDLTSLRFSNR